MTRSLRAVRGGRLWGFMPHGVVPSRIHPHTLPKLPNLGCYFDTQQQVDVRAPTVRDGGGGPIEREATLFQREIHDALQF